MPGRCEINVNLETDRHEAQLGYRIMNRAHGMWSLGFFVTALISAGVRQLGVPITWHLVGGARGRRDRRRSSSFPGSRTRRRGRTAMRARRRKIAFPTIALAALCVIGAAPLLVEGARHRLVGDLHARHVRTSSRSSAGMSVTLFSLFMAMARLSIDPVVDRYSPRAVAATLLVVAAIGLVMVAMAPHPYRGARRALR